MEDAKKRTIAVNLTDEECDALARKCGAIRLTVGELIESFINDLVDGSRSNGSDEREYADQWFERCFLEEQTLLNHLLCYGYEPEDYLELLDNIETAQEEKTYLREHPEEAGEEAQYIDDDIVCWEDELKDLRADWKPDYEPKMDEEIEIIRKWVREKEDLINADINAD